MNVVGIVCEYNPFHSGHEYLIKKIRESLGADSTVVCVMSGDFVQRGEAAVFSKYARAEASCRCGADLVVELPLPWALSSAEGFASGAVGLLSTLGVSHLCFGSETGELQSLEAVARCIMEDDFQPEVKTLLEEDASLSYAMARQRALERRLGSMARLIALPNNILAVEYLKAIYAQQLQMKPLTFLREGAGHDTIGGVGFRSAADIRRMLSQGLDIAPAVPAAAYPVFDREIKQGRTRRDDETLEVAILSRLRMFTADYYAQLPDTADGAGQRLHRAAREEPGMDAVVAAARTKRYSMSRIRRMCLCAALGVTKDMSQGLPPYARVLAANERGCALLRDEENKLSIPVISKPASVRDLDQRAQRVFAVGAAAHDLFALAYTAQTERKGGNDWRIGPKIV